MWKMSRQPLPSSILLQTKMCPLLKLQVQLDQILINRLSATHCFYVVVIFFRLNATSPSLNAYIFCQIISCPAVMSILTSYVYYWSTIKNSCPHVNIKVIEIVASTVYGVWNLDFFRMAYKPFCLHPNIMSTVLQIISLDYLVAVYPLCLVCFTFLLVKLRHSCQLHQKNFRDRKPHPRNHTHF